MIFPPKTATQALIDTLWISGKSGFPDVLRILREATTEEPEIRKGMHFYEQGLRFQTTTIDLFSKNVNDPDGCLVVLPGLACSLFGPALPRIASDLLDACDGSITRCDAAVDLRAPEGDTFDAFWDEIEPVARDGSLVGPNDKFESGRSVACARFGSRASARYLRIYDKGLEQGIDPDRWIRFEAEFKHEVAKALTDDLKASDDWTEFAQSLARGCFPKFEQVFPEIAAQLFDAPAYRPEIPGHTPDLDRWIETFQQAYGGRHVMASNTANVCPYEAAKALRLFDCPPTKRLARHGGFLSCYVARLNDIIGTDG